MFYLLHCSRFSLLEGDVHSVITIKKQQQQQGVTSLIDDVNILINHRPAVITHFTECFKISFSQTERSIQKDPDLCNSDIRKSRLTLTKNNVREKRNIQNSTEQTGSVHYCITYIIKHGSELRKR